LGAHCSQPQSIRARPENTRISPSGCATMSIVRPVTTARHKTPHHLGQTAAQIFAANDRLNQMLLENLDPAAWVARSPGKTRTIAAIFTHMHNVRCKWVRLNAPHLKVPKQLHRTKCSPKQARAGLAESAACCAEMLAEALGGEGRIENFVRDGWARPWPVGIEMLCYMISHEAHHRGQICMLAQQLGFPLPQPVGYGLWNWEKVWKDCDASAGPGRSPRHL